MPHAIFFEVPALPNAKINRNIIGDRVKEARLATGMDQAELSATLSVEYNIEIGPCVPPPSHHALQ